MVLWCPSTGRYKAMTGWPGRPVAVGTRVVYDGVEWLVVRA